MSERHTTHKHGNYTGKKEWLQKQTIITQNFVTQKITIYKLVTKYTIWEREKRNGRKEFRKASCGPKNPEEIPVVRTMFNFPEIVFFNLTLARSPIGAFASKRKVKREGWHLSVFLLFWIQEEDILCTAANTFRLGIGHWPCTSLVTRKYSPRTVWNIQT